MIHYRLCFINPRTGQVDRERDIEAHDDVDAVHSARDSDHRPLELWCGGRKVRTFGSAELASLHA
jgi:hypothetical protein